MCPLTWDSRRPPSPPLSFPQPAAQRWPDNEALSFHWLLIEISLSLSLSIFFPSASLSPAPALYSALPWNWTRLVFSGWFFSHSQSPPPPPFKHNDTIVNKRNGVSECYSVTFVWGIFCLVVEECVCASYKSDCIYLILGKASCWMPHSASWGWKTLCRQKLWKVNRNM